MKTNGPSLAQIIAHEDARHGDGSECSREKCRCAATADTATYAFESFDHACAFLDACVEAELPATLHARESQVDVQIATWKAREKADALAGSAPCVAYEFGKKA